MTTEERLTAIENELAAIRDARRLEASIAEIRNVRDQGTDHALREIRAKILPGLAQAMEQLEASMEAVIRQQNRLTEQFGTHSEWLANHTQAMAEMREHGAHLDERIDKLATQEKERGAALDARIDKLAIQEKERGAALDARIDKLATQEKERGAALDARIDKLVSAIGELISRPPK